MVLLSQKFMGVASNFIKFKKVSANLWLLPKTLKIFMDLEKLGRRCDNYGKICPIFRVRVIMGSIYLLIPLSLMLFAVAIWAITYAVKSNQFEDLDNAPDQIILDDRQARRETLNNTATNDKESS